MKKNYNLTIFLLFMAMSNYTSAQNKPLAIKSTRKTLTPPAEEKIARQLFQSFKTHDESLWKSLYPSHEEYKEILQLMLKEKMAGLTQEKIDEMMVQRKKEATALYSAEFKKFTMQADSAGIKWGKAVYSKFDYLPYLPTTFSKKYLNGDLWCLFGKTEFVIEGIEAVETPAGFRLQSIKAIRKIVDSY